MPLRKARRRWFAQNPRLAFAWRPRAPAGQGSSYLHCAGVVWFGRSIRESSTSRAPASTFRRGSSRLIRAADQSGFKTGISKPRESGMEEHPTKRADGQWNGLRLAPLHRISQGKPRTAEEHSSGGV